MSATNRGGTRLNQDTYFTPHPYTYGIVPFLFPQRPITAIDWRALPVIDPACGNGQILAPLRKLGFSPSQLYGFEIDLWLSHAAAQLTDANVTTCDSLQALAQWRPPCPVTIIGNPPYSLAFEFFALSYAIAQRCGGQFALFLRLGFLESDERRDFLRRVSPFCGVASSRPSFVKFKRRRHGKVVTVSSDASAYGWIGYSPERGAQLFWIPLDDGEQRVALIAEGFTPPADLKGPARARRRRNLIRYRARRRRVISLQDKAFSGDSS